MTNIFDSPYHNFGKTVAEECSRGASSFWLNWCGGADAHQLDSGSLGRQLNSNPAKSLAAGTDYNCVNKPSNLVTAREKALLEVQFCNRQVGRFRQKATGVVKLECYVIGAPAGTHEMMKRLAGGF
jgi:hypothetical protein